MKVYIIVKGFRPGFDWWDGLAAKYILQSNIN